MDPKGCGLMVLCFGKHVGRYEDHRDSGAARPLECLSQPAACRSSSSAVPVCVFV